MRAGIRIHRGLVVTIAVAAAAGYFGERSGDSRSVGHASAATTDALRTGSEPKSASLAELVGAPRAGFSREARADLFAVPARPEPAPQKAAPAIAQAPVVPPFPYKYAGWVAVGAQRVHYLHKENEVIAIGKGEVLDGAWRVDALSDERIEVSYVPLGQQLSMLLASLMRETAGQGAVAPGAVASAAHTPARALSSEPAALPAAAQPATAAPTVVAGAIGFPSTAAPAQTAAGSGTGAATKTASASGNLAAPGASSAVPTGRLGLDAPTSGSMPTGPAQGGSSMPIGPAPAGTMPAGPAPTGKLGL